MQYAQLTCARSHNIGDDIQSIAAAQFLPRVDLYVDREKLNTVQSPVVVIMNAWFLRSRAWPPSDSVYPVFVGFHVARERRSLIGKHASYLKRYEPIGTRDQGTADFLTSLGIRTEVTYCLTLTLPQRDREPADARVIIVDADEIAIPRSVRSGAVRLRHHITMVSNRTKLQHATDLIEFYRHNARLVITTRIHCALPCIAMGIPVVFFGSPKDYRTAIIRDIGGIIYDQWLHAKAVNGLPGRLMQPVDWNPAPLDVESFKRRLRDAVACRIWTQDTSIVAAAGRDAEGM